MRCMRDSSKAIENLELMTFHCKEFVTHGGED